jgi:hypothetical protein
MWLLMIGMREICRRIAEIGFLATEGTEDTERVGGRLGVRGELCCKSELFPQRLTLSAGSFEERPICGAGRE